MTSYEPEVDGSGKVDLTWCLSIETTIFPCNFSNGRWINILDVTTSHVCLPKATIRGHVQQCPRNTSWVGCAKHAAYGFLEVSPRLSLFSFLLVERTLCLTVNRTCFNRHTIMISVFDLRGWLAVILRANSKKSDSDKSSTDRRVKVKHVRVWCYVSLWLFATEGMHFKGWESSICTESMKKGLQKVEHKWSCGHIHIMNNIIIISYHIRIIHPYHIIIISSSLCAFSTFSLGYRQTSTNDPVWIWTLVDQNGESHW